MTPCSGRRGRGVVDMAVSQLHRVSAVRAGAVVLAGPKHVSFMYILTYRVSVKALANSPLHTRRLYTKFGT